MHHGSDHICLMAIFSLQYDHERPKREPPPDPSSQLQRANLDPTHNAWFRKEKIPAKISGEEISAKIPDQKEDSVLLHKLMKLRDQVRIFEFRIFSR